MYYNNINKKNIRIIRHTVVNTSKTAAGSLRLHVWNLAHPSRKTPIEIVFSWF